jgi:hypothetical protein
MANKGQTEFSVADQHGFVHRTSSRSYRGVPDELGEGTGPPSERTVLQSAFDHQRIRIAKITSTRAVPARHAF